MGAILADVGKHWYIYLSIPIMAAIIGYVTKLVAIRMMFRPLNFVGVKPFGWQGIVPKRAARMAAIACDTMTEQLIKPSDVLRRLDPELIAKEIQDPLREVAAELTQEIAAEFQPGLWESLPDSMRRLVIRRVQAETPRLLTAMLQTVQDNVESVFDLRDMVITNLVRDKALLNRIFTEAGHREFQFIARAGLLFGAVIGVIQMVAWALFKQPLIMPFFGVITGWFTDWLALRMIFRPQQPTRYLGIFTWQGMFLRRRDEVSESYATLIAEEVITPHKVIEAVLRGPLADRLFAMMQREVEQVIDRQARFAQPFVRLAIGSTRYMEMKHAIADKVLDRMPETLDYIADYAKDAMDIRNLLIDKMRDLTTEEFENLLRPAFQQDEWILITCGAVLGGVVGELQSLILEHFAH
ncbi:MAG TPA: DUF445 family protein [Pseudonocardiaceae bacterium]|jgi:uncharacterized membrane protein YheB (UPF0754 family)|nr:DUF445 family protein [Pseudonocardiaceae bacterium]